MCPIVSDWRLPRPRWPWSCQGPGHVTRDMSWGPSLATGQRVRPVQTIAINQQTPVRGAQCCWNTNQSLAATWTQIKYLEEILEGCKILLSSRKISNFKLAPIFVIWLMLHKGKFGWKCLKVSCHVSRASLYIRYWSMAHTVGTCVLRSWPRPTWRYQWIKNIDSNFEC